MRWNPTFDFGTTTVPIGLSETGERPAARNRKVN
jgi:hypothetical protein